MPMSLGLGLGLTRQQGGFSPLSLFAGGEEGAWYEPGVGSLQTSSGTITESGVGDPVGFQLDQSQGAGFSGGAFTGLGDNVVGPTWVISDPSFVQNGDTLEVTNGVSFGAQQSVLTTGAAHLVTFEVFDYVSGEMFVRAGSGQALTPSVTANGTYTRFASAASNATLTWTFVGTGTTLKIRNIVVREIPGNHATQSTAAARPTLRQTGGGLYYLDPDGVDDWMPATGAPDLLTGGHTHVGGWQSVSDTSRLYATSNDGNGALRVRSATSYAFPSADVLINGTVTDAAILAVEAQSGGTVRGWYNGTIGTNTSYTPAGAAGLALFSRENSAFSTGYTGDFYGGLWIDRALTDDERASAEAYFATKTGVTL